MISFRNRRAALLPSTLTFAFLCQAGLLLAQSPEGGPLKIRNSTSKASPTQDAATVAGPPSRPCSRKLEELTAATAAPCPTTCGPTHRQWRRNSKRPRPQQPAPCPCRANRCTGATAGTARFPWSRPAAPATESEGSVRQQLSDYYASQGKLMPGTHQRVGTRPKDRRHPAASTAGRATNSGSSAAAAPQPRIHRSLNPFRSFWHKDDSTNPPPATYGNATAQAMSIAKRRRPEQPAPAPLVTPQIVQPPVDSAPADHDRRTGTQCAAQLDHGTGSPTSPADLCCSATGDRQPGASRRLAATRRREPIGPSAVWAPRPRLLFIRRQQSPRRPRNHTRSRCRPCPCTRAALRKLRPSTTTTFRSTRSRNRRPTRNRDRTPA